MVFVPLTSVAFSTLPGTRRGDGTAFYSLMRDIGSSIGISVVEAFVTHNTQTVHASLVTHLSVFDPAMQAQVDLRSRSALAQLDEMVMQQASMIAYLVPRGAGAVVPLPRRTRRHGRFLPCGGGLESACFGSLRHRRRNSRGARLSFIDTKQPHHASHPVFSGVADDAGSAYYLADNSEALAPLLRVGGQ